MAGTILLYWPRWIWSLPLLGLLPAACVWSRRSLVLVLVAAVLSLGPILGFNVPWQRLGTSEQGTALRVLTCNTLGGALDIEAMERQIASFGPDVVAFQEWDARFKGILLGPQVPDAWQVASQRGLCLASRYPILSAEYIELQARETTARVLHGRIACPDGVVSVFCVHFPTPREVFETLRNGRGSGLPWIKEFLRSRSDLMRLTRDYVKRSEEPCIVAGDFNMTTDSPVFRSSWVGFDDAFLEAGFGYGFTKYTRWHGTRIDHLVFDEAWRACRCWVGPPVGSDHLPVMAELARRASADRRQL